MIKVLLLLGILTGCGRDCLIETTVPVEFKCDKPELLRSITVNFYQGSRVVMSDIIFGSDFKDGVFKLDYKFYDTDPDLLVWKVQEYGSGWVQYETIIK